MVDLVCREVAGPGNKWPAFLYYRPPFKGENTRSSAEHVCEPRKDYGSSRDKDSADSMETGAHQQDIFSRLDRLRSGASENSIKEQLERLQGIAALMQARDQGPMPGELLRIYAWEIEDTADKLKRLMKQE